MKIGDRYELYFNPDNINNAMIEIRAIVDDQQVVYIKNGRYHMDSVELFDIYERDGHIKAVECDRTDVEQHCAAIRNPPNLFVGGFKTEEIINIPVKRYRDCNGKKTCANDFTKGNICIFLVASQLGTKEHCIFDLEKQLERRGKDGLGTLIPGDKCIVFKANDE